MSYMRGEHYVYSDGKNMILPGSIPMKVFDELVVMRLAELTKKEIMVAEKRAIKNWYGNFGCAPLLKKYKRGTSMQFIDSMLQKEIKRKKK